MIHHGALLRFLYKYTLPGMFGFMCLENLGVPFVPIELGYVVVQTLISQGKISYFVALIVFTIAHIISSVAAYFLGERFHKRLVKSKDFKNVTKRVERWYDRYGAATVLVTRFIGQIRPFSSYIAGIAEMPFAPFLAYTALGAVLFNAAAISLTKVGLRIWSHYPITHLFIAVLYIGGFVWFVLSITNERRKNAEEEVE